MAKKNKVSHPPVPNDDVFRQRRIDQLTTFGILNFGNIWWIHNDYWFNVPQFQRPKDSTNIEHKGCSILPKRSGYHVSIPFLFGTSKFHARAVQIKRDQQKDTFYGPFPHPLTLPIDDLIDGTHHLTNEHGNKKIRHDYTLTSDDQQRIENYLQNYFK